MKSNKSNSKEATNRIPDEVINSLARCILPSIRAYFESEEGNREFEEWKATREKNEKRSEGPER